MRNVSKILIVFLALIAIASSAQAAATITLYADQNAAAMPAVYDITAAAAQRFPTQQGAPDANIGLKATDLAGDTNYFIAVVRDDNGTPIVISDINGATGQPAGVTGTQIYEGRTCLGQPCAVIQTGAVGASDANFDTNFSFPSTISSNQDLNVVLIKAGTTITAGTVHTVTYTNINDANATQYFIVTPALLITAPKSAIQPKVANNPRILWEAGDWNVVTIRGYGMARNDLNYMLKFADNNGLTTDLNFYDVNYAYDGYPSSARRIDDTPYTSTPWTPKDDGGDNESGRSDMNKSDEGAINGAFQPGVDLNGFKIAPDTNRGNFDVNIIIPFSNTIATDVNITARAVKTDDTPFGIADVNTTFYVIPNLRIAADQNITVGITSNRGTCVSGGRYDIMTAILGNCISDVNSISNLEMRLGTPTAKGGIHALIVFTAAVNLGYTSILNYDTLIKRNHNLVSLDDTLSGLTTIDANITLYNLDLNTNVAPTILKNGQPCSSDICSNISYVYNATDDDGNLSFTTTGFSQYQAVTTSGTLNRPNGFENIRSDANYTISFSFSDLNAFQSSVDVNIFLIDTNSAARAINHMNRRWIGSDTNLLDATGVVSCDWSSNTDRNLQKTTTCTMSWDPRTVYSRASGGGNEVFTTPFKAYNTGAWKVDLNVTMPDGNYVELISDNNFTINKPRVKITDVNGLTQYFGFDSGLDLNGLGTDGNWTFDFNVFIPDNNTPDLYSLQVYTTTDTSGSDKNILFYDANLATYCSFDPATRAVDTKDYNCSIDINSLKQFNASTPLIEGPYYVNVDVNRTTIHSGTSSNHQDANITPYTVYINDATQPAAPSFVAPATSGTHTVSDTGASSAAFQVTTTDNANRIKTWYYSINGDTNAVAANTGYQSLTVDFSVGKFTGAAKNIYVWATDFADLNSPISTLGLQWSESGGGSSDSGDSSGSGTSGGSSNAGGGTTSTTTTTTTSQANTEQLREVAIPEVASENAITALTEKAGLTVTTKQVQANAEKAGVASKAKVEKITAASGTVSYKTTFTHTVQNKTENTLKNVKVVIEIPKGVAATASLLKFPAGTQYKVLVDDPVIEITVPEVQPNSDAEVAYFVEKNVSSTELAKVEAPIVTDFTEDLCPTLTCSDGDPCTIDSCANSTCSNVTASDGTSCGSGRVCQSGDCVEAPQPTTPTGQAGGTTGTTTGGTTGTTGEPASDNTGLIILVVVIIIIVVAFMAMRGGGKKKR